MSRPASCSGVSGSTPATASGVDFWKNSGTISTRPPTAITSRISTIIRKLLVSIFWCEKPGGMFELMGLSSGVGQGGLRDRRGLAEAGDHRHPDVPGHHQHAAQ